MAARPDEGLRAGEGVAELLDEPLKRVEVAVFEAKQLTGDARTRRVIEGLLDSIEVHRGLSLAISRCDKAVAQAHRKLAFGLRPYIAELLAEATAEGDRELRITMAVGAVEGLVTDFTSSSPNADTFAERLQDKREVIVDLILKILH